MKVKLPTRDNPHSFSHRDCVHNHADLQLAVTILRWKERGWNLTKNSSSSHTVASRRSTYAAHSKVSRSCAQIRCPRVQLFLLRVSHLEVRMTFDDTFVEACATPSFFVLPRVGTVTSSGGILSLLSLVFCHAFVCLVHCLDRRSSGPWFLQVAAIVTDCKGRSRNATSQLSRSLLFSREEAARRKDPRVRCRRRRLRQGRP